MTATTDHDINVEATELPEWLVELSAQANALIERDRDHFARKVKASQRKSDRLAYTPPPREEKEKHPRYGLSYIGHSPPLPLPFSDDIEPSIEDAYAIVAAIPLVVNREKPADGDEYLCRLVTRLGMIAGSWHSENERPDLERCVERVREDVAGKGGDDAGKGAGKKPVVSKRETALRVREWFENHTKELQEDPYSATVRTIVAETGCSQGYVSQSQPWQAFVKGREERTGGKKTRREAPYCGNMDEHQAPDDKLDNLIEEQDSDWEPSPLDKTGANPRIHLNS